MPLVPTARRPNSPATRWEPLRELEEMQDQMGRLLGSTIGDVALWVPPVDIEETEDSWIVEAEVPGAKRDDIDIQLNEGELVITGEIKERERKGLIRRQTRRVGRFEYRVRLPGPADPDKVDASLGDGVLKVTVPKAEQAKARRIEISDGSPASDGGS
jgi:HSP20 family protein